MADERPAVLCLRADRRGVSSIEMALIMGMMATVSVTGFNQVADGITAAWKIVVGCFPQ